MKPVRECPGLCGHAMRRADVLCADCTRKLPPQLRLDLRRTWEEWNSTWTRDALEAYGRCIDYAQATARARNGQGEVAK